MNLLKADNKPLFHYSKNGIILIYKLTTINLTELFLSEPNEVYEILDNLLELELNTYHRKIVNDVKKDFKRGWVI